MRSQELQYYDYLYFNIIDNYSLDGFLLGHD
jgi:hypothetical protein